jgi:hypothetical protein
MTVADDTSQTPRPSAAPAQPPRGPVTLLSRLAGVWIVSMGTGLAYIGPQFVTYAGASRASMASLGVAIGIAVVIIGLIELLGGIGILKGKGGGRWTGIGYSVFFGALALQLAFIDGSISTAWIFAPARFATPAGRLFGPIFVGYAYALVVLSPAGVRPRLPEQAQYRLRFVRAP